MDVDDQAIARFMETTHASADQAQFFLEACGGNFERATNMFYEQTGGARRPHPPDVPPRPQAPHELGAPPAGARAAQAYPGAGRGALPPPLAFLGALLGAPFALLAAGVRLAGRAASFGATLLGAVARAVLPRRVFAALAGVLRSLTAPDVPPARAAEEFARDFNERYGEEHPVWQECGWGEAATRAHQEAKFLFVYLHSPQHQDTDAFCRGTLCNPAFAAFVNEHFVAWGGDLRSSDAFRLASSLRVARYPYIALLAFSGPRTRLITCVEGRMAPQQLQEVLQGGMNGHGVLLWQERLEREQRETDRRLREEQDAEYQRSLEADRQREAAREAAAREAAEAERAARDAAERARAEAEAAEAARAAAEAALRRRQSEKAMALPEEPAAGTPSSSLIRIRLPDGSSHQRRFLADGPMQVVYDWVDSLEAVTALNYSLASTFPRRVYGPDTRQQSLKELGLEPQAVLLMQSEDD